MARVAFSPRPWGCSVGQNPWRIRSSVFPTPVGMFRFQGLPCCDSTSFPHARGDVPGKLETPPGTREFSPRPWGCSEIPAPFARQAAVFPTPVGMFRSRSPMPPPKNSFPHARGDVPVELVVLHFAQWFSPRPWGCSGVPNFRLMVSYVFPTPVGMFRQGSFFGAEGFRFPHARGDVPRNMYYASDDFEFSPRPWGCSAFSPTTTNFTLVFPTPVGMFQPPRPHRLLLPRFPHARGDVPVDTLEAEELTAFSPRPWGCSAAQPDAARPAGVFPTPVGMFRRHGVVLGFAVRFPHARGDVPPKRRDSFCFERFSPRPWGCSLARVLSASAIAVFPTPVGMFRYICGTRRC